MPNVDHAVLRDPRFWHGLFATQFSMVAHRLGREVLEQALGTVESDTLAWWTSFTRSYPGVIDESDGYVDDPSVLDVDLPNDIRLLVEYHPGGTFYRLASAEGSELLGETGPHWRLPGLRWSELMAISAASERMGSTRRSQCLLVLLPLVWPESAGFDVHEEQAVATAIGEAGVAAAEGAAALASAWVDDIRVPGVVRWSQGPAGARSENGHGTRGIDAPDPSAGRLNRMIDAAGVPGPVRDLFWPDTRSALATRSDADLMRIGTDGGGDLVVDRTGAVRWLAYDAGQPDRFVNSTVTLFGEFLKAVGAFRDRAFEKDESAAIAAIRGMREELRSKDPPAFKSDDSWWSVVLEQIEDGLL